MSRWEVGGVLFVIILIVGTIILYSGTAQADPLYQAAGQDAVVLLHSEPCALDVVANLPKRATWTEGGKTFEGCWGARQDLGLVVAYFTDKSIALIPVQMLTRAVGA